MQQPINREELKEVVPAHVTLDNIVQVVADCMSVVGRMKNLTGLEKKFLVMDALKELDDQIIGSLVPSMVDKFISIEKGDTVLNVKIPIKENWLLSCFKFSSSS